MVAAPPLVGDPFFKGWIQADGSIDPKVYDRLPPELIGFKDTFSRYKTANEFLGAFAHSASLNGRKGLMPLPQGATDQQKAEYNTRMRELNGTPAKPEDYGIKKPDNVPADQWNEPYVNEVAGILHKHNASPDLVKELLAADLKAGGSARQSFDARNQQEIAQSREEIAKTFGPKAQEELAGAVKVAAIMGLDVNDPRIGNNSKIIIGLAKVAKMFGEDTIVKAGGGAGGGGMLGGSPREASLSIKRDPANPLYAAYHDQTHPRHAEATSRVYALDAQFAATQKGAA